MIKKQNYLVVQSQEFALRIIDLGKTLILQRKEYVLSKQIIKSGTSIGANIAEAQHAESRRDFASKLSIALKEARETSYWLLLLEKSHYVSRPECLELQKSVSELTAMLIASIKTAKKNT